MIIERRKERKGKREREFRMKAYVEMLINSINYCQKNEWGTIESRYQISWHKISNACDNNFSKKCVFLDGKLSFSFTFTSFQNFQQRPVLYWRDKIILTIMNCWIVVLMVTFSWTSRVNGELANTREINYSINRREIEIERSHASMFRYMSLLWRKLDHQNDTTHSTAGRACLKFKIELCHGFPVFFFYSLLFSRLIDWIQCKFKCIGLFYRIHGIDADTWINKIFNVEVKRVKDRERWRGKAIERETERESKRDRDRSWGRTVGRKSHT